VTLAVLLLSQVLAGPAWPAFDPLTLDEKRQFNWAFATEIGSGIYDISGRTLQVYQLPLSYTFRKPEGSRYGWRFTYPITFGFFSFSPDDIIESGLSKNVATLSVVPGVELLMPVRDNWLLRPYAEAGRVWDRTGDVDAGIYSIGIRSRADFEAAAFHLTLGNGLISSLVDPNVRSGQDFMVMFETAFEAGHLFSSAGTSQADFRPYVIIHLYYTDTDHPFPASGSTGIVSQYEVGITFGSRGPLKVWGIGVPRIGVGYLFGHDLGVVRIVFGTPAPSLEK
jgi:hypothetical protein